MKARWIAAVAVVFLTSAGVRPVAAQTDATAKAEAKARFVAGQSHYNLNEFAEALVEFKEAYRLLPDPVFLYNSGQCERQLGHLDEAVRFYRSFLREQPKAPNRQDVLHKIDEIEAILKTRSNDAEKTAVVSAEPTASPAVDNVALGNAPVPEVEASPPAAASSTLVPAVAPATLGAPAMDLTSSAPAPATVAPSHWYGRWWFWAGAAAVAAGVGVAIYEATSGQGGAPGSALGTKAVF